MLNESDLDTLDGICFVTDLIGEILAVGPKQWDAFASQNNAPELTGRWVINQNLFNYISGPDVRMQLKHAMQKISSSADQRLVMLYRCDAPHRRRIMRQSISPVCSSGRCEGFLFQSVELRSEERPPVDLFDFAERGRAAALDSELPIIAMCSWCQRVLPQMLGCEQWLEAESYFAAGGCSNVCISHSICESCFVRAEPHSWRKPTSASQNRNKML